MKAVDVLWEERSDASMGGTKKEWCAFEQRSLPKREQDASEDEFSDGTKMAR